MSDGRAGAAAGGAGAAPVLDLSGTVAVPLGCGWTTGPGATSTVRCPYDDARVAEVPELGPDDAARAVETAAALAAAPLPLHERAAVLDEAARRLAAHREEAARLIALEAAKPIRTARGEADRAVETLTLSAAEARQLAGEVVPLDATPTGAGKLAFTRRRPVGPVAAITPFNFPLNLVAHKVGPAVAAGCPVVVKPAPATPLSAILLARLLEDAGLPPGWVQVLPGGAEVGAALVDAEPVRFVSFTGSDTVGWAIAARAPRKRVALELGSNAPLIVDEGGDWAAAADRAAVAGFTHAGQSCVSVQRVYVHERHLDDFLARLVDRVAALRVGHPLDEEADLSSVISRREQDRIVSWIESATAAGATVLTGGGLEGGHLRPTVVTGVPDDHPLSCREVFGPVVAVAGVADLDEAVARSNASPFGLQAGVFTPSIDRALRAVQALEFGTVLVNEVPTFRVDSQPYGGVKDSGNTREGPRYAIREMTEEQLVMIDAGSSWR
ncbi:MAG TPA: aldehyde dehydrogenase family protein [Acidimicrobiales bacterium]